MGTAVNLANGFLQLFVVYGTLNLGFIYLYRTTGIMNFAQGQIFMFAAMTLYYFSKRTDLGLGTVIAMGVMFVVGYLVYVVFLRLLQGGSVLVQVLGTFMIGAGLAQVAGLLFGPRIYQLSVPNGPVVHISGGSITTSSLVESGSLVLVALLLDLAVNRTAYGAKMRAAAEDGALADYLGIKRHRLWAVSWGIVFLTAVLAGYVYAGRAPVSLAITSVGFAAFPAAIIGGMDSLAGMAVGAALAAFIQTIATYYTSGVIADMITFAIMLLVLLVKPTGLLGHKTTSRI